MIQFQMKLKIIPNFKLFKRNIWTSVRDDIKVKVGDVNINYESTGAKGPVALCLPGSMGCIQTDFGPQVKGLGDKNINAVFWDPPGYGQSIPPKRDFSYNFFVRDAEKAAELMKVLGFKNYSLLGWSDGGITALQMALKYPESVNKLIIWGANAFVDETDTKKYETVRNVDNWSERMRKPMEEIYGKEYFKEKWMEWCDAMTEIFQEHNGEFLDGDVSQISCPTLIIHGAKDPMVGEEHAQNLHKKIKNSELVIWQDGKHNLHLKYASEFNDLVAEFLKK